MSWLLVAALAGGGCTLGRPASQGPALFDLAEGQVYGPPLVTPITIRLGQSMVRASGSVGPSEGSRGSPAHWEGHAVSIEPDQQRARTLFALVEGDELTEVVLQINDLDPLVEHRPGAYLTAEFSMVRWAQEYTLRVSAENAAGASSSAAIHVSGEDAWLEGSEGEPGLHVRLMRMGNTEVKETRGLGYQAKIHRHHWLPCSAGCDLTSPGNMLVAMVAGPADSIVLRFDENTSHAASGLNSPPSADLILVTIAVREESHVELAAHSEAGAVALGRWDRPG